ncbi:MAG: DUF4337 domain-containing protein [Acidobacteriia bacterium]|nr:DUF4337 domain-containing protein [Terriglobia bacterium]
MEVNEVKELHEVAAEARTHEDKRIGLTMAIVAVLLAVSTMLGHRTHTESVLMQTRATDQWAYYQAKNIRAHMYEANSQMAALGPQGTKLAEDFKTRGEKQRADAESIRAKAEQMESETQATERKAGHYNLSEIFFEIAIVLCSISLLAGASLYWRLSFISTLIGIVIAVRGAWLH